MKFFYKKVQELIKQKGLSINKLAMLSGVTQPAASAWLKGKALPRERSVVLMAKALGVSTLDISDLEESEEMSEKIAGYFQGWGASLSKSKKEMDDPCEAAINNIENIKQEQYRLKTVTNAFMTTMQSMLYVKNFYGEYIVANESYLKAVGLDININIIGQTDKDFMSQKVAAVNTTEDMVVINTGKIIINKTVKFPFPNAKIKHCVMTKVPLRDDKQNIVGVVASFTDITDEFKFRKQGEMLKEAIIRCNAAIAIVFQKKNKRELVYANDTFLEILGCSSEDVKKDFFCWFKNVDINDMESFGEFLDNYPEDNREISFKYKYPGNSEAKYLTIRTSNVKDVNLTYNVLSDETEKYKKELKHKEFINNQKILSALIENFDSAIFIGDFNDFSLSYAQDYIYRNKKSYEFINKDNPRSSLFESSQREKLIELDKQKKYPRILIFNAVKTDGSKCTVEEKLSVYEINEKKYCFFVINEIEQKNEIEVYYPDNLKL